MELIETVGAIWSIANNGAREIEFEFLITTGDQDVEDFRIRIDVPSTGDLSADLIAAKRRLNQLCASLTEYGQRHA